MTVSVGVAPALRRGLPADALVARADAAAYRAKFSGRNTVALPTDADPVGEAERVLADAAG